MKPKILIFLFTILTMGLFLIPNCFAKYNTTYLNSVNVVSQIDDNPASAVVVRADLSKVNFNTSYNLYVTLSLFDVDSNYSLVDISQYVNYVAMNDGNNLYYLPHKTGVNSNYYYNNELISGNFSTLYFYCYLGNDNVKERILTTKTLQFQILVNRINSNDGDYPFLPRFIGNSFYNSFGDLGVFNTSSVQLRYYGSNSYTDISDSCLFYNTFQFNSYYVNLINNTNNVNSNGNYYIRFYFNNKIRNLSNFNLSYVELLNMSANNSYYSGITNIRNALPIINNGITLYNDNTTLFSTNDLVNSGYGDFYIEYIDFRIADYSFKSSTYFNSGLGISGYLSATKISSLSVNAIEAYNNGFDTGVRVATEDAYNNGFRDGVNSNRTTFDGLMLSVANVPMKIISSMLGFEILGVNLLGFFMGIITLLLFVRLMRKFKE